MKSERRHELQHNELADWIERSYTAIAPHFKPLALGTVVVLGAVLVWQVWRTNASQANTAGWAEIYNATMVSSTAGPGDLEDISEKRGDSGAGLAAAASAADARLAQGCSLLYTNRTEAGDMLEKALKLYDRVAAGSREPWLRERALFGRARAYEALSATQGMENLAKAVVDYKQVATQWPDGPYGAMSARCAAYLETAEAKTFYEKFAAYKPKAPSAGKDALPNLPFDAGVLPDDGNIEFSKPILNLGSEKASKDAGKDASGKEAPKAAPGKDAPKSEAAKEAPKGDAGKTAPAAKEPPKSEPAKK